MRLSAEKDHGSAYRYAARPDTAIQLATYEQLLAHCTIVALKSHGPVECATVARDEAIVRQAKGVARLANLNGLEDTRVGELLHAHSRVFEQRGMLDLE